MSEVSAKDVAALRKASGAGMMDCKKALVANDGDFERSKTWLREQGLVAVGKRAGRVADQGAVAVVTEGNSGAIVELSCETDFVAKGAEFRDTVEALARQVATSGVTEIADQPYAGNPQRTVAETVGDLAAKLGENISLGRICHLGGEGLLVDGYCHVQNERGTIGVLVALEGVDPADPKAKATAHDLALHIASAAPRYVGRDEVSDEIIANERAVLETLTRNEGKPEAAISKIVEGRLGGFYKENVLVEQGFVRDTKVSVGSLVEALGSGASVRSFVRVRIGEE